MRRFSKMAEKALEGVKVLEYTQLVSGPYCAKLFANFGAEVIKIEEPGIGDEARRRGPFPQDIPHPERSGLYLYLNTNKVGITLNTKISLGKKLFKELVKEADVLIENTRPGTMAALGLDYESLRKVNDKLIMASITPFGQTGPHSSYKSYYLNTFHSGGEAYTMPPGLSYIMYPDREPIKIGGFIGEYDSATGAFVAILAALYARNTLGVGQYLDISQQEVLLGFMRWEYVDYYSEGFILSRATRFWPVGGLFQCKDGGYVIIVPFTKDMWDGLVELMGNPDWAKEEQYQYERLMATYGRYASQAKEGEEAVRDQQAANGYLAQWAMKHTKEEVYYEGQEKGCVVTMINNAEDVVNWRQLQARDFFVDVDHPEVGRLLYAGAPYKLSETPCKLEHHAPLLGEHNEEIYVKRLGYSREDLVRMRQIGVI